MLMIGAIMTGLLPTKPQQRLTKPRKSNLITDLTFFPLDSFQTVDPQLYHTTNDMSTESSSKISIPSLMFGNYQTRPQGMEAPLRVFDGLETLLGTE